MPHACRQPDPDSERRYGLPGQPIVRYRATAVLWRDAMYVYGGSLGGSMAKQVGEMF